MYFDGGPPSHLNLPHGLPMTKSRHPLAVMLARLQGLQMPLSVPKASSDYDFNEYQPAA
jgi:hypothetical protein